ncbi:MAG: VWA domain-containing protein [Clostridiaceae bacterium]|jgi:hypothetical protein|nr:VWA domain-containing protein [Clostridiaceae bacterium]
MKLNKRIITIGILILAMSIIGKLVWSAARKIKVDDFHPEAVMFVVDSSASNQKNLPEQKKILRQICNLLDPEDKIKIFNVSEDAYLIYEGSPMNGSEITKAMNAFTQYNAKDYGTAYGIGMRKAFKYALSMKQAGYNPAIVVIGDLANEGDVTKQLNWSTLPKNVAHVKTYAPELTMMFLDAHPSKLDLVKDKLTPVLGETKLIVATKESTDKAIRTFINVLGR